MCICMSLMHCGIRYMSVYHRVIFVTDICHRELKINFKKVIRGHASELKNKNKNKNKNGVRGHANFSVTV